MEGGHALEVEESESAEPRSGNEERQKVRSVEADHVEGDWTTLCDVLQGRMDVAEAGVGAK